MFHRFFIACLALALVAGNARPPVSRAENKDFTPASEIIYKTYAGVSFSPISSDILYTVDESEIYATASPGGAMTFVLPLDLPQGAQITTVDYYVFDNSETTDVFGLLGYFNPETSYWLIQASKSTTGASSNIQMLTTTYGSDFIVDNSLNFYFLRITLHDLYTQAIAGARVGYTLASSPSGSQAMTLGGDAFRPEDTRIKYAPTTQPYKITLTNSATGYGLGTRLDFPPGTQITGVTFYVYDNDPTYDIEIGMPYSPVSNGTIHWIYTSTAGASEGIQEINIPGFPIVTEAGYGYSLNAVFNHVSSNLWLAGARLTYILPPLQGPRTASYINGTAFLPGDSSIGFTSIAASVSQRTAYSGPLTGIGLSSSLDLPQGAYITRMSCYAKDNDYDPGHVMECGLVAYRPADAASFYLYGGITDSPPSSPSIRELKVVNPAAGNKVLVNNMSYEYRVWLNFHQSENYNVFFIGVVVETGFSSYLPAIRR